MSYRIAGIDVHKKMLAVAVADVEVDGDFQFERQKVGTTPIELRRLADWLGEHEVDEVVMESTAQYWRPVWETLEQHWRQRRRSCDGAPPLAGTLHLAQAQSNRGPGGRKRDFPDAERLVKRLIAQELPAVCCRRWPTAKPIRPPSRHSRPPACAPRPSSCAMSSRRVRRYIRCTVGC